MRWLVALCSLLCCWFLAFPASAQVEITAAELDRGEAIAADAITAAERGDFATAEHYWSQLIERFPSNPAVWSNRGNVEVSQNKLDAAIADYNQAIQLAPDAPDPYLNRGLVYERQQDWAAAIADYNRVLEIDPEDAFAYNNRGNAAAGQGDWAMAIADYERATEIAPDFAFARANRALALYEIGQKREALHEMRSLARRYPVFADIRAALTAVLWVQGNQGEAESNWVAAVGLDSRYRNLDWVREVRRWPPAIATALERFLTLDAPPSS
ncbi:MAG: tetratricopeptide repeat protein [Spirulinaceae cyanobacterium SM2_1_0]|nr:tetratricopeptide repeat protein [Spirulinaceae cyanobacterium SM2_1_0]